MPRWAVFYLALLGATGILTLALPTAFQKSNSIRPAREFAEIQNLEALDVAKVIGKIPYDRPDQTWAVDPSAKHRETILEGHGDCSNLSHGLAYQLIRDGIDFQVIDFFPKEFLRGVGHTVVRTRYQYQGLERTGLVDLLEGGLPRSGEAYLDVLNLTKGPVPGFAIEALNERKDSGSKYYGEFLDDVVIGYIPASELRDYHRFIERIYFPLGSRRLEKYLYDGAAVIAGVYPRRFIPDYDRLVAGHRLEIVAHQASAWLYRSALVLVPLIAVLTLRSQRARSR